MITLKEFMELVDYKITDGSDYYTNVPGLYMLNSWTGEQDGYSFDIAFDPEDNQRVYLVEAHDLKNQRAYRLIDPAIDIDKVAYDDVNFVDLESDDDFLQKALAIKAGEDYDTRVSIPLDLPEDELMVLFKLAHEADMTFNEYIEKVVRDYIEHIETNKERN